MEAKLQLVQQMLIANQLAMDWTYDTSQISTLVIKPKIQQSQQF